MITNGSMEAIDSVYLRRTSRQSIKSLVAMLVLASAGFSASGAQQPVASRASGLTNLPPDGLDRLEKQKSAMRTIYFEFREVLSGSGSEKASFGGESAYSAYFEGGHFYQRKRSVRDVNARPTPHDRDTAFDGDSFYFGNPRQASGPAYLTRFSAADVTDPDRWRIFVQFTYLDAAGFYAPERITELTDFACIEPLVLHELKEGNITKVQDVNEHLMITVRVPDRYLLSLREMDMGRYREELESRTTNKAWIAKWMRTYERLRDMQPERTVSFLLDPQHGYAVTEREEWTAAGQRILLVQSEGWKYHAEADIWLPSRCVASFYTRPAELDEFFDRPIRTITSDLTLVEFVRRDVQFALDQRSDYKHPGTVVTDRTVPEARASRDHKVIYTVAANGTQLKGMALSVADHRGHRRFVLWFIAVNAFILSALVAAKVRTARRRRKG